MLLHDKDPKHGLALPIDVFLRSQSGLGIGLTLLRSLVGLHNGSVDAHSDGPGQGSTFTVRLPLGHGESAGADGAGNGGPVRTVVVVEDQADARRMMQLLLESMGVRVFAAENGKEGAALIAKVQPDPCPVRLVALSGYGQDADVQAALDAGFDEHITKPPDPDRLSRLLNPPHTSSGSGHAHAAARAS